jgi:hypothetical protein
MWTTPTPRSQTRPRSLPRTPLEHRPQPGEEPAGCQEDLHGKGGEEEGKKKKEGNTIKKEAMNTARMHIAMHTLYPIYYEQTTRFQEKDIILHGWG